MRVWHGIHTRKPLGSQTGGLEELSGVSFLQTVSGTESVRFWTCTTFAIAWKQYALLERRRDLAPNGTQKDVGISRVSLEVNFPFLEYI